MSCPSDSEISGFVEHRLSSEHRAEVEVHVDDCASCRRVLVEMVSELRLPSMVADARTTHPVQAGPHEMLARGTAVGRFIVLDQLGAGGMSVVYTAYDPELDRKVALKLLRSNAQAVSDTRALLLAEAQAMARISHANVIAVFDVGTYRDQVFAAVELVEGTTLRRWLAQQPRRWCEVVEVLLLAGEGLAAAHAASVVHRDFKPENVLLGHDGRVKVADFGLATRSAAAPYGIAGTLAYLAIEGFGPGGVDERGDQFSFCVTLHEALHGSRPFSAQAFSELVAQVRRGPVLDGDRGVPARLNQVVRRGLALAPEDRYPSMRALLADLRRAVAARRIRRRVAAAAGATALVIGATAIVTDARGTASPSPCSRAADQLTGVWDRARRAAVEAAFLRTATPAASEAFERTAAAVDRYAVDWSAIWTDACEATEVRREQSAGLLGLRMACLDRARIQLRALGDVLSAADRDVVRDAVAAAGALPALDACSDPDALRAIVSPPLGAVARAQIETSTDTGDDPTATAIEAAPEQLRDRPDFRLPFACGDTWQLTYRPHHPHADKQIDFYLPGEQPSAGFAVFISAPGWVSRVAPDNGEVDINHGGGWFTTYQHMTDISVSLHRYVGRGQVLGRVGNVNVTNPVGGPGAAHLHYEQVYRPGVSDPGFDRANGPGKLHPALERERFDLSVTGTQIRTSTNNCFGNGTPVGVVQYEVPVSAKLFSRSRDTMEIMTRRSGDHALFERWYSWGWYGAPMPHTIVGRPAVAVFAGELHVIARKSDGTIFDFKYDPFTGWKTIALEGRVSGDPDVAVYGRDRSLFVAARGADGFLYRWWTVGQDTWTPPIRTGDTRVIGTPAVFSHYDTLYVVARGLDHTLTASRTDRRRSWAETRLPGTVDDDPDIGVDPTSGLVNVVARGTDHKLYRWQSTDRDRAAAHGAASWAEPELIDADHGIAGVPATTIYRNAMHIVARGQDNAVHHWWKDATWHREGTGGTYLDDPAVVQFGGQLQTVGRGPSGSLQTIWYDPATSLWNIENQDVPVTD